jgi:hypothetical protein
MSETNKVTPGPWRIEWIDSGMCNGIAIGARVMPPEPFTGPPVCEVGSRAANARLIAAAPELLAALKEIVSYCYEGQAGAVWREALAAIAKAEGSTVPVVERTQKDTER